MLRTEFVTIEDFNECVEVAQHCDWNRLNIAINDALEFDLPEYLCEYYGLIIDAFNAENPTDEQLKLLNGDTYKCGKVTRKFLGAKRILIYYSYGNYLMNSTINDSGLGFVRKESEFSTPVPIKEVREFDNSYRNRAFSIIKQLKEYIAHLPGLAKEYGFERILDCGCYDAECGITEKRIYTFRPKIIKKRI